MTRIKLPYVQEFAQGRRLYRYFRHGRVRVRLPGAPGSPEFMAAYTRAAAAAGARHDESAASLSWLIAAYYRSAAFTQLRPSTQATYRGILERLRAEHGSKPYARMERRHVQAMIDARGSTPAAAENLLMVLRLVLRHARKRDLMREDPTRDVELPKQRQGGFHTWAPAEVAAFEARWPLGTLQRMAMTLMLYTGARRSDAAMLGRQHIQRGRLVWTQTKTGREVAVRIMPELQAAVDAMPREGLLFVPTVHGAARTIAGFGGWFRSACDAAGLRHCSAHGLRKAAATRMAEAGCTASEIMAVLGHQGLKEAERYTREADRARLADAAVTKLGRRR